MRNKGRTILGFFSLLFFIYIIIYAAGGFGQVQRTLIRLWNEFFPNSKYEISSSLFKQEVVEEESSIINVVDSVSPAVVSVVVKTINFDVFTGPSASESGIGTGFIVDSSGLVVTNSHVADNEKGQYSVLLKDGSTYDVTQIHLDPQADLAILEISGRDLPTVELGDSDKLKVGQRAIAIGNALGRFSNTVTVGVVSGIARELTAASPFGESKNYEGVIQTDAALNPGNSGGPLLNSSGQVIGINVATTQGADNIGFAIPVNTLRPILESFLKEGKIVRPFLGVEYSIVTKELADLRKLPVGAFVSRVVPGSPAQKAGITRGDIIVTFEETPVDSENSLFELIRKKKVGDKVELVVDRSGKKVTIQAVLEEVPDNL